MTSNIMSRYKNLDAGGLALVNFGLQPVSNRFLKNEVDGPVPEFQLLLHMDSDNGLIHMAKPFPVEALRPRYSWMTCFEPEEHLDALVQRIIALPGIDDSSVFGAYSFKDDTTLERLQKLGYANTWRLDPAKDLAVEDPLANVETFQEHFTVARAQQIREQRNPLDVFIVRHVLEHSYDLGEFLEACKTLVRPGGLCHI